MRRDNEPATAPGVIRLEIYADLLCPWCFIEKRSLDALTRRYAEEHPDVRFEVVWKPYYIAPAMAKRESPSYTPFISNLSFAEMLVSLLYMPLLTLLLLPLLHQRITD